MGLTYCGLRCNEFSCTTLELNHYRLKPVVVQFSGSRRYISMGNTKKVANVESF